MKYFSTIYGLVTKHDPGTENGGLFLAHLMVLEKIRGEKIDLFYKHIYISKMQAAFVEPGLYRRSANHINRTVSHDEITGMIISSSLIESDHGKNITKFLLKNCGCYPATGDWKFYSPADYYAWLLMTFPALAFLFFPLYLINLLISSNKPAGETSSKLIYLSELHTMKDKSFGARLLWRYFSERMRIMYGELWVQRLYEIYFQGEDQDHPLLILSKGIVL